MSQHIAKQGAPPAGLSSFTKIRLGWIRPNQVQTVKPGETALAFLSPLSKTGDKLVVKIPLKGGTYYLVENRQPVGFDKNLPASGLLILRVDPGAQEGYGTVEVMTTDRKTHSLSRAALKLEENGRDIYIDSKNGVVIIPLWTQDGNLGVVVTTPDRSTEALESAKTIQTLKSRPPEPKALEEAVAAFMALEFAKSHAIAQEALRKNRH
jgi:hypothetical protein